MHHYPHDTSAPQREGRRDDPLGVDTQLADFFENAAVGLHWVGPDGTIVRANRAELELLGYSAEEYVGHHIAEFHADADAIADILGRLKAGEELHGYEAPMRCKDGSIKHVAISSNVLWQGDRFLHTRCVTQDITARRAVEESLREREAWLAAQGEALEAALNGAPLGTSLGVLVRTAREMLGGDVRAAFYLANAEGTALHHVVGMDPGYAQAVDGFPIGPESLSCGLAVHTGEAIVTRDVMEEPLWSPWRWLAGKFDVRGCWSFPLHTSARMFAGTLAVYWREPREASARELQILARVTQAAGIIIARNRDAQGRDLAQAAERRQAERLRLLWDVGATLLTANAPDVMLRGLFAKIGPNLGVDAYFNYRFDERGDGLRLASFGGIPEEVAAAFERLGPGEEICGAVARRRQPMAAFDIQSSSDAKLQRLRSLGIRAYACNPLEVDGTLLGTLSFASYRKDRFDGEELTFIETICHYAAVAYERLRLLAELKEGDRRKDEFLATLAHELRNPLAPVSNAVQVMRIKGGDLPELRWSREVIQRQVDHLTRLIDDLLDVSRITRDKLELRPQRLELAEVIRSAIEAGRPLVEQRGHELAIALPAKPAFVHADMVRLSQVFLNLLNNAAKYTEAGGRIVLRAECDASTAVVTISDNGVGIARENLPRLFQMFFQADRALEKSHGGLGIGLALVRRLVELHGGTVEVRSDGIGHGSEFTVRLPLMEEEGRAAAAEAATS